MVIENFKELKFGISSFGILLLFIVILFSSKAYAETTYNANADGTVICRVSDDGATVTISGNGAMSDYTSPYKVPWIENNVNTTIKKVIIENGVTHIGSHSFGGCEELNYVTIGESVTSIGEYAFYACPRFNKISLLGRNANVSVGNNVLTNTRFDEETGTGIIGELYCYSNSSLGRALWDNYESFIVNFLNEGIEIRNINSDANTLEIWVDTNEFGGEDPAKYLEGVTLINDNYVTIRINVIINPGWDDEIVPFSEGSSKSSSNDEGIQTASDEISESKLIKNYRYEDNDRYVVFDVSYELGTAEGNETPVRAQVESRENGNVKNYYSDMVYVE